MGDKKYIESLSNFADALDQLVEEMQKQSKVKDKGTDKPSGKPLDIENTLVSIQEGIDQIKDDTKKILDNQDTLLKMSKDSDKSGGLISGITDKKGKGKIKEGVSTIILMAGAVLAIGLAFQIVGGVDFASVIALSIALPLLAHAFGKVAETLDEFNLNYKDILITASVLVILGAALTLTSWVMSGIVPIGIFQFLTAVGISIALSIVALGASFMLENLKDVKYSDIGKIPFILVALATGITASSWVMGSITPINFMQFLTGVGIAITLAIISVGVSYMMKSLSDVDYSDILKLPIILVAMATGIMLSSLVLNSVVEVPWMKLLNIAAQAIVMAIMASLLVIPILLFDVLNIGPTEVAKGSISLVLIAGAIALSSQLISMGDYSVTPSLPWAFGAAAGLLMFSIPIVALGLLSMTGVGLVAVALGAVMALIVAGTMVAISHILNKGDYSDPGLGDWVVNVGMGLTLFTVAIIALGVGMIAVLLGSAMALIVAGTIVAVSHILKEGDYSDPGLGDWVSGVGGSLMEFTLPILALGAISATGIGLVALLLGSGVAVIMAHTIVEISNILGGGDYSYASNLVPWAEATTLLYKTFTPIMTYLGAMGLVGAVVSMFGGPDPFELARDMMVKIAETIVDVSDTLSGGSYGSGPTEDWAKGVSLAIGGFAPIYSMLQSSGVISAFFGGEAMKPEEYTETMENIGKAINKVGEVFAEGKVDKWEGGPTEDWAKGVGGAIGAFAPIFGIIQENKGFFGGGGVTVDEMTGAIEAISESIKAAAVQFNDDGTVYKGGPDEKWSEGVGGAIKVFTELYGWVTKGWDWTPQNITDANKVIFRIAGSILNMSKVFQGYYIEGDKLVKGATPVWSKYPDSKWTRGVSGAIQSFADIYTWADKGNWDMGYVKKYYPVIMSLSKSILDTADQLSELNISDDPSKYIQGLAKSLDHWTEVFDKVEDLNTDKLLKASNSLLELSVGFNQLAESLTNVGHAIEGFNPEFIKVMADVSGVDIEIKSKEDKKDEEEASWWSKLLGISPEKEEETTPTLKTGVSKKEDDGMKLEDIHAKLEELNQQLQQIAQNSSNMSDYVDELRSGSNQGIEIGM